MRLQSSGYNNSNNKLLFVNDVYDLVYSIRMLHQDESTLEAFAV